MIVHQNIIDKDRYKKIEKDFYKKKVYMRARARVCV